MIFYNKISAKLISQPISSSYPVEVKQLYLKVYLNGKYLKYGEAKNAKETFRNLSTSDRTEMIQFLQSL